MYYPHPLIARQIRQFPILQLPWRRYLTATNPDAKAFEKRQYRKAARAYRLMARSAPVCGAPKHYLLHRSIRSCDLGRFQITPRGDLSSEGARGCGRCDRA